MSKFRVMIVDDEVRTRRSLNDSIQSQLINFEVVAVTSSMSTALIRLDHSATDFLVVDFDLLENDSPPVVQEILRKWGSLTILSYRASDSGIRKNLHALGSDRERIVVIDTNPDPEQIASDVVTHLRKATRSLQTSRILSTNPFTSPSNITVSPTIFDQKKPALIVIGVSTGGPNALTDIIPLLPASFDVPILIVQHMPASFILPLAERLTTLGKISVQVAQHGEKIKGSMCRIAPGECHLEIIQTGGVLSTQLTDAPPENSCKPAADVLFRSAAKACGNLVLGIVLTGMGRDGCAGSKSIREAGGNVIVQDEPSSVVWGMPGAVVESNLANKVLPLNEIAPEIIRLCR